MGWAQHIACMGEKKGTKGFLGKYEEKLSLRKDKYSLEDNIKIDINGMA
jgi:hypothetical protein